MRNLLLMAHLILIAMGTGLSFSNLINLRLSAAETGERFKALALQRRAVAQAGDVVISLIWASGVALALFLHAAGTLQLSGWFAAKLLFVVALTACHALGRHTAGRLAQTGDLALLSRLRLLVGGVWLSALAAIILAVAAFE